MSCCLQIIEGQPYNASVDWFSFGVVLFEMLAGKLPFDGADEDEMFYSIRFKNPKFPSHFKPEAASCVRLVSKKVYFLS